MTSSKSASSDDTKFKKVVQHFLKTRPSEKKPTRKGGETKASPKPRRKKDVS